MVFNPRLNRAKLIPETRREKSQRGVRRAIIAASAASIEHLESRMLLSAAAPIHFMKLPVVNKAGQRVSKPVRNSVPAPGSYTPNPTLTYHGGAMMPNVQVENVFYAGYDPTLQSQLGAFFTAFTNSKYLTQLDAGYSQPGQPIGAGSFIGKDIQNTQPVPAAGSTLDDSQIRIMLGSELTAARLADPTTTLNKLYFVFTPAGVKVTAGTLSSTNGFIAYHSSFTWNGKTVAYAVMPYQGPVASGITNTSVGGLVNNFVGLPSSSLTLLQDFTVAASHELTEAVTDTTNGWSDTTDPSGGLQPFGRENSDMAELQMATFEGYAVQEQPLQTANGPTSQLVGPSVVPSNADFFINEVNAPTNGSFNGVIATFTDKDGGNKPASSYTAGVNWSDGKPNSQTTDGLGNLSIVSNGDGTYEILGKHTYSQPVGTRFGSNIFNFDGFHVFVTDNAGDAAWKMPPVTLVSHQTADVTAITSTVTSGYYGAPVNLTLIVDFSHPVFVTGSPNLLLNSGGAASYTSGSGTTQLTFNYLVGSGESTAGKALDAASASGLTGTIKDASGVAANLTLPTFPLPNSLGGFRNLVIYTGGSLLVTTTHDGTHLNDGTSLRDALAFADSVGGGTINFDTSASTGVITLGGTELPLSHGITVNGPGANQLTVNANNLSRVFDVSGSGTSSISGLTITGGNANGGGGIFSNATTLNLNAINLAGNTSTSFGGGLSSLNGGSVTITNSTISNNTAANEGGGIEQQGIASSPAVMTLTNCTIYGNVANGSGLGAISNVASGASATLTVRDCTIAGNTGSASFGGGILNAVNSGSATATYIDTIFSNTGPNIVNLGGAVATSLGHNLSSDNTGNLTAAGDLPSTNAKLGVLASNGGPTPTVALLLGSPAAGAGISINGITADQRGVVRHPTPDIGAFEAPRNQSLVVTTLADEDNGNADAFYGAGVSLREAIHYAVSLGGTPTITFAPSLTSGGSATITLGGTELLITGGMSINGPGANLLTISGNNKSRVFDISSSGTVAINGLTVSGGNDAGAGGGIFNNGSNLNLNAVVIDGNNVGSSGSGFGGGLASPNGGTIVISNSTISNNTSGQEAGGLEFEGLGIASLVTLTNCTISGNKANGSGLGAITNVASGANTALALQDCTVANNTGAVGGGVINAVNSGTATVTYIGTIFANNGPNIVNDGTSVTSLGHNISSDGTGNLTAAGDFPNTNPNLGALANNGGTTPTMALSNSPAIGGGVAIPGVTADQRGIVRHTVPDIGAFEAPRNSLIVTTLADENNGNADPAYGLGTSLREAINYANTLTGQQAISFASALTAGGPATITLGGVELLITGTLIVFGPGANLLSISGNNASRVFDISGGGTVSISGVTITSGHDTGSNGGGGIYSTNSTVNLNAVMLSNNSAVNGGAVASQVGGAVTITNSTLSGNTASNLGSAVEQQGQVNAPGTLTLINCTITGNSATGGGFGVISNVGGGGTATLAIQDCTIAGNTGSTASAGSVYNFAFSSSAVARYAGTIFANSGSNIVNTGGTVTSLGHNLSTDATGNLTSAGDLPSTTPLLATLGNYGGTTPTMPLLPGSPAIDAGVTLPAAPNDQRGITRPQSAPDIGAFESRGFTIAVTGGNNQSAPLNPGASTSSTFTNLQVTVSSAFGEPVAGGIVTFTAPVSGASAILGSVTAAITGNGTASMSARPNGSAGSYSVNATTAGASAAGVFSLSNTKATAAIQFGNLSFTYDGSSKLATATTTPSGLNVVFTYTLNGQPVAAPINAGNYTVTATINDTTYAGTATSSLVINRLDVTSSASITRSGFRMDRATGKFVQTVTITNLGATTWNGPVTLSLSNISSGVSLFNTTAAGNSEVTQLLTVASGSSVSFVLQFTDPTAAAIAWSATVLLG